MRRSGLVKAVRRSTTFLRLCVETGGADIGVVDTVLLASCDPEFLEFEEAVRSRYFLQMAMFLREVPRTSQACGRRREVHRIVCSVLRWQRSRVS